jgi:hypothetical protein
MGWADIFINVLKEKGEVSFNPSGNSMQGKIESGDRVTVISSPTSFKVGDIVLCKVKGKQYLHLISAIEDKEDPRIQISNNKNYVNGWIKAPSIYGICIQVNDKILTSKEEIEKR